MPAKGWSRLGRTPEGSPVPSGWTPMLRATAQQAQQPQQPQQPQQTQQAAEGSKQSPRSPRINSPRNSSAPRYAPNSPIGGSLASGGTIQLSPDLGWAIVPATSKLFLNVPVMLHPVSEQEQSLQFSVGAKGATGGFTDMLLTRLLRTPKDPNDESGIDEYLSLSLPENANEEFVSCALTKTDGSSQHEYHVYLFGKHFFGTIMEDQPGSGLFTLWHDNQQPALIATLHGAGLISDRKVEIMSSQTKDPFATGICSGENYSVECFPNCDVLLAVVMLAAVDRLSSVAK